MAINIVLEDARGERIDEIIDFRGLFMSILTKKDISTSCCLRFIDPYGDTIFNRLQTEQFLAELADLYKTTNNEEHKALLSKIDELAKRCLQEPHLFIKFYGD